MARPTPVSGTGITAMRRNSGVSSRHSMSNRFAAASATSPAALRLSVLAASPGTTGPNASKASSGST